MDVRDPWGEDPPGTGTKLATWILLMAATTVLLALTRGWLW